MHAYCFETQQEALQKDYISSIVQKFKLYDDETVTHEL